MQQQPPHPPPPPPPRVSTPYRASGLDTPPPRDPPIHPGMVTVTDTLPGHRVVRALGIVHGVALQHMNYPRHVGIADMIDAHQRARREALAFMIRFAAEMGANAVIGVRYDTSKISRTQTEFLAYGTAAWAEPLP
jgi:uncharacterized protein YbjQ (UPF0145 family)